MMGKKLLGDKIQVWSFGDICCIAATDYDSALACFINYYGYDSKEEALKECPDNPIKYSIEGMKREKGLKEYGDEDSGKTTLHAIANKLKLTDIPTVIWFWEY